MLTLVILYVTLTSAQISLAPDDLTNVRGEYTEKLLDIQEFHQILLDEIQKKSLKPTESFLKDKIKSENDRIKQHLSALAFGQTANDTLSMLQKLERKFKSESGPTIGIHKTERVQVDENISKQKLIVDNMRKRAENEGTEIRRKFLAGEENKLKQLIQEAIDKERKKIDAVSRMLDTYQSELTKILEKP
ncbi:hypothetical protein QAD02_015598 [Eretmocerus hayati]|uniref:Uncharacterized protein n=1 Tax=Eretmocerus hayati TaxID=131215 RepID=A0ACC2PAD0_9HYME|nr:hypothetical protein QAD02_015598 [Eretmocerus hayati]